MPPSHHDPLTGRLMRRGDGTPKVILRLQHYLAQLVGVREDDRADTVFTMLQNNAQRAPGYWIQLVLAGGIATLGLVLDSTAVVIGAMLVSPLMGPILELGMGFAVGSSFLVIRASLRVVLSVVTVIGGAAMLTVILPFHDITREISARAAPTALDLIVAMFCALTATYITVRPGANTTAAAAGTAIGIALVPPLCACGFGIGTASAAIASGAALLFVANLSAILVLSVASFVLLGYNQVDADRIERDMQEDFTRTDRAATRGEASLQRIFGSRYGLAMRLLTPVVFVAAVFLPLRNALREVTWEVRARDSVRRIVDQLAPHAVQTALTVARHTVALRLLVVGRTDSAMALEKRLGQRIAAVAGVTPTVTVVAVADARSLAQAAAATVTDPATITLPAAADPRSTVNQDLKDLWPSVAGPLVGASLSIVDSGPAQLVTRHIGSPLGETGTALLAQALSTQLGVPVVVKDVALPTAPLAAARGGEVAWLAAAIDLLHDVARSDRGQACVTEPVSVAHRRRSVDQSVLTALQTSDAAKSGRITLSDSTVWSVRIVATTCAPTDSVAAPPASKR